MNYNKSGIEQDKKIKKLQKERAELKKQLKSTEKEKAELQKEKEKGEIERAKLLKQLGDGKRTIFFTKLQAISGLCFAIFCQCYLTNTSIPFLSGNIIGFISIILFIIFIISLIKG